MNASSKLSRIPQLLIDDLISKLDIVEKIGAHLKLRKEGQDYVALCPFHRENTPSFSVSPSKQFYYCFGCGASGNAVNFLMEYQQKGFLPVLMDLAEEWNVDVTPYLKMNTKDQADAKILPALIAATEHFEQSLKGADGYAKMANEYLAGRGLTETEIAQFRIGVAGHGDTIVKAMKEFEEPLKVSGILDESEGRTFSLFRERVTFPVRDVRGKIIGLSGRALKPDVKPKYRNSKETALFSRNTVIFGLYESLTAFEKDRLDEIYMVEGQFDVVASLSAGIPAGAAMGSSLSLQQLRLLLRHASRTTFVFDGDEAGAKALIQTCRLLMEHLMDLEHEFNFVMLPEGEDPHSMLSSNADAYHATLAGKVSWIDAYFTYAQKGLDLGTEKGKNAFVTKCLDDIHGSRDPLIRHSLLERLCAMTSIPVSVLSERMAAMPEIRSAQAAEIPVNNDAAIRFVRMLWDDPELSRQIPDVALLAEDEDELLMMLGVWAKNYSQGHYDAPLSEEDQHALAEGANAGEIDLKVKRKGGAAALGRLLGSLSPEVMHSVMQGEPEDGEGKAALLAWHITGQCAGRRMQELTSKSAMGLMEDADRARFIELRSLRQQAISRTR